MPNRIKINLPNSASQCYDVLVGKNITNELFDAIKKIRNISQIIIITDDKVKKMHGDNLRSVALKNISLPIRLISFPNGEKNKNQKTVTNLSNKMFVLKCDRNTLVIALGGGVVGDVAGFVASTYMRGISLIQMPTTLLAIVDSSVGGKVGIDNKYGKNLIGAFYQPSAVVADINLLDTLPQKHLLNGLFEIVKIFITHDKKMFNFVRLNIDKILKKDSKVLQKIIQRAIELKTSVVMRDEVENNERRVLNFGHTIGHALETLSGYKLLHGEAVGIGMIVESKIAKLLGILSEKDYQEIVNVMNKLGVDKKELTKHTISSIIKAVVLDKKTSNGNMKCVLIKSIGVVYNKDGQYAHVVESKTVERALKYFK